MIADVIVDIAASETDRIYSYLCDDTVAEGSRVYAPFGGRVTAGFVVALRDSCDYPAEKLKKVTAADPMPALNAECLSLAKKIAARYACPLAAALRLFLPAEMRKGKVRELKKRYAELCVPFEEAKEKCLAGMKILVREGSAARNVENIVPGLVKEPEFIAHFMFCTDDKHLDTIENEGHISYNIKKSIQLGIKPISAVRMATYNAAKTYGLNDIGVLEEGKDADIVVLDSLESVEVHSVYKQGRIVNTEFFTKEAKPVNESMLHTVVLKDISKDKIQVEAEGKIPVIGMIPGQIVTKFLQEEVPSKEGLFTPDSEYSKLCVFERHRGTGNATAAPIKGYGITNGAIATSVAHDSHNIIAAGDNDEDIIKAVQTIEEIQGGYALVSEGKVLGTLPLTVAGLLSQKPAKDIQKGIDELLQKAWKLGISRDIDPFITLSFMALPVIPSLRLTDLGLVDVDTFQLLKS